MNIISRFEDSITLVRKTQVAHAGLGSPSVSATEEWVFSGAILPAKRDRDSLSQGISTKSGKVKLYARLDVLAKKSGSPVKKTLGELGLEARDEIASGGVTYLIDSVARYEKNLGFISADITRKPIAGGV